MSKKGKKNKKFRSRLARGGSLPGKPKSTKTRSPKPEEPAVVVDVRRDLRKTALLTAVCLGILLALYLTQSRWSNLSLRF